MNILSFSLVFCFSFLNAFAQPYNYEAKWKEVEKEVIASLKDKNNIANEPFFDKDDSFLKLKNGATLEKTYNIL
jgi:hypothetical protein